jgi:hypothetical protein
MFRNKKTESPIQHKQAFRFILFLYFVMTMTYCGKNKTNVEISTSHATLSSKEKSPFEPFNLPVVFENSLALEGSENLSLDSATTLAEIALTGCDSGYEFNVDLTTVDQKLTVMLGDTNCVLTVTKFKINSTEYSLPNSGLSTGSVEFYNTATSQWVRFTIEEQSKALLCQQIVSKQQFLLR